MTRHVALMFALTAALAACSTAGPGTGAQTTSAANLPVDAVTAASAPPTTGPLMDTVAALDARVFAAFNTCDQPGQLEVHASFFSPSVEFYHDHDGVTWTRADMIGSTAKYVCGNYRRELIPGTLRVYPIKDFGAIEQGVHRFCQFKSGACEGAADFVIVWHQDGANWTITRVLSYGHRPLQPRLP